MVPTYVGTPLLKIDDVTRDVTVMLFRPMGLDPDEKQLTLEKHKSESCTPPTINIEPENDGLEGDFPFPGVYSQVPC